MERIMFELLAETVVISFAFGGVVGALVALGLRDKKKAAASSQEEESQETF